MASTEKNTNWPGERDPSHGDVASANERPDPILLSNFKTALMSSADVVEPQRLLLTSLNCRYRELPSSGKYTYPLALLSRFPKLPDPDREAHLHHVFKRCADHVFFDHFPWPALTRESMAPLRFGAACLASVCCAGGVIEAETLFSAGSSLWPVMVEVDNSLARSVEMLLAAVLLIPCGVLATTESLRLRATLMLSSSLTIARRMRLHHPEQLEAGLRQRVASYSPMLWSLWLWDVLHALHSNLPLNVSAIEILSVMPASTVPFQQVYRDLIQESGGKQPLLFTTGTATSRDQALLLLLAILSDLITVRRSLGSANSLINPAQLAAYKYNPFVPFSAHTELEQMQVQLYNAMDRWHGMFGGPMSQDIRALYLYCRLYLSCPTIESLRRLAENQEASSDYHESGTEPQSIVLEESVDYAWSILDASAACPKTEACLSSAWMPIVVFHAALVVWASIGLDKRSGGGGRPGSIRALLAFQLELEAMHWPCCINMSATVQRLISR